MGIRKQLDRIFGAVPGAHAALHWCGWLGLAALIVPAVVLAMLVVRNGAVGSVGKANVVLLVIALAALVSVGVTLSVVLSSLRRLGEMTELLTQNCQTLVFVKDRAHRYRFVNKRAIGLLGHPRAAIVGQRDSDFRPGAEALAYEENDRVCLERDLPTMFRETQTIPGVGRRSFLVSKYPLHDGRGRVAGLVGSARDITEELELEQLGRRCHDEQRFWFELNPLPMLRFAETDGKLLAVNLAAEKCYGYAATQLLHMHLPELFASEEAERLTAYLRNLAQAPSPGSVAWRHRRAGGAAFDVLADIGNLPHAEPAERVMRVRDVSGDKMTQRALAECTSRYQDLFDSGLALVWLHDLNGRLLKVNGAMADALGYTPDALVGHVLSEFVAEEAHATWDDYMDRVRSLKHDTGVLHLTSRGGEHRVWQYRFTCYPNAAPAPYVLGMAQDVTLRRQYELRTRDQNLRDSLTGCQTRRWLETFAWQAAQDQVWGCAVVDVDYLRQINTSEGRARGDEILRELANLLRNIAGSDDVIVRLNGDEFAIISAHADATGIGELAAHLRRAAKDAMPAAFSFGWALRVEGEAIDATLRRADKMLLRARAHGDSQEPGL